MRTEAELEALARAFEDASLPRAEWTHAAHLAVALWLSLRHPPAEAADRMAAGLRRYTAAYGNPGGYHETITRAWMAVVARFLDGRDRSRPAAELLPILLAERGEKDHLLRFYTPERLQSDAARAGWMPPDRAEIG